MSYSISADIYDLLYQWKGYAAEAVQLRQVITERQPAASSLLDVACGSGRHLEELAADFEVAGIDLDEALVAKARQRLPDADLRVGDMRDFDFGRRFDVVTCLFSAIGYMHTPDDLARAVANMAGHLREGGLLIVEPWLSPEAYDPQHIGGPLVAEGEALVVVRMNGSRIEGRLSVMDFHHLVGRPGSVEYVVEEHALALYTDDEYSAAFEAAGLRAEHDEEGLMGRGLWIGRAGQRAG
jgi:SAM-dependent methyltransferase